MRGEAPLRHTSASGTSGHEHISGLDGLVSGFKGEGTGARCISTHRLSLVNRWSSGGDAAVGGKSRAARVRTHGSLGFLLMGEWNMRASRGMAFEGVKATSRQAGYRRALRPMQWAYAAVGGTLWSLVGNEADASCGLQGITSCGRGRVRVASVRLDLHRTSF